MNMDEILSEFITFLKNNKNVSDAYLECKKEQILIAAKLEQKYAVLPLLIIYVR